MDSHAGEIRLRPSSRMAATWAGTRRSSPIEGEKSRSPASRGSDMTKP